MMQPRTNRRRFLHGFLFLSALSCGVATSWPGLPVPAAQAEDDGGSEGGDGGGSDSGGSDSGGSDSGGSDSGGSEGGDDGGGGSSGGNGGGTDTGSGGSSGGPATGSKSQASHDTGLSDGPLAKSLRGKIAGVGEIEVLAKRTAPGEVLGIELNKQGSDYVYSVRIMQGDGTIVDLEIDAVSRVVTSPRIY